ncbi:uncharacterized protein [Branchiostoma lanceolatum]|uniref:uncharacterized protein isoform X2 n=1 Tax=Branchiostoma lanceolatum TaxID=7740 RepID=UPI003456281C
MTDSVISGSSSGRPKTRVHVTVRTNDDGDPQIVHVRVSPPQSTVNLAEGATPQDSEGGEQRKEQPALPHKWQLTPKDEKMQALFNFNETAIPLKNEFFPADESSSEKLELLYGNKKVSPCCEKCSSPCCCCCVVQ